MLKVRSFQQYIDLYPTFGEERQDKSFAKINDRWQVCVRLSNIGYQHVSFVNSIATTRGGNHVKYITDQIIDKVIETAKKKAKGADVKPHMIKPHIWIFISCLIDNPSFDSQAKETLNTTKGNFGSTCTLPQSMVDCVLKSGLLDRSVDTANSKLTKQMMAKAKSGGGRISGIPKLEDANDAGSRHGHDCTLILTEGDSAKALAVGGLGTIGRDKFGVFPLRGKPLNVRDAGMKKILVCSEIQSIIKIMGLKIGETYTSTEGLRYGHIMVMSDQDHDGSHIKGLIVNFIHHFWPSLTKIPGFLTQFITPIVKAFHKRSGGEVKSFFCLNTFLEWRRSLTDQEIKNWNIKYYKGLGTSTSKEGKEYFSNLKEHKVDFSYVPDGADDRQIVMAFAKDKVDDRKKWILEYKAGQQEHVDYRVKKMRYRDFIDKELIQFSIADCERSIPSVVDGLKPGQRKILFSCFKRNLRTAIKVAQLAGYVSEHAAYHHGEASLQSTIVGLAQDYVGANNIPLLYPDGQFGTRLQGGKDCASARYIFTRLAVIARSTFHKSDDDVLDYKDDDGFPVEPQFYVPVIPMVLVNGTSGIGTGFATSIPNYNPWDIIANIKNLMNGRDVTPMVPWYYGFHGTITEKEKGKYMSIGKCIVVDDMLVQVKELPIGYWTGQYKQFLEELVQKEFVISFREYHTDITVDFDVVVHPEVLRTWKDKNIVEEKLDLRATISASNLMCFDEHGKLTKYSDAEAILKAFFIIRLEYYGKRKDYMLAQLRSLCEKLKNMVRFLRAVISGTLIIHQKKKVALLRELRDQGFKPYPPDQTRAVAKASIVAEVENVETTEFEEPSETESPEVAQSSRDYEYLLGMKLWSLTAERVAALEAQVRNVEQEIRTLEGKSPKDIWSEDLIKLEASLKDYYTQREKESADALKKLKDRRRVDVSRVKVGVLSDTAKKALARDVEAADKKTIPKRARRAPDGLEDEFEAPARKPAAKRSKKPKKKDDDDESSSSMDSEDREESEPSDDDDVPLGVLQSKKKVKLNNGKQNKSPLGRTNNPPSDDDDFDLDAFGVTALKEPTKAAQKEKKTSTANTKPLKPEKLIPAKKSKPVPVKRPKKALSEDSKESSSEESEFSDSDSDYGSVSSEEVSKKKKPNATPQGKPKKTEIQISKKAVGKKMVNESDGDSVSSEEVSKKKKPRATPQEMPKKAEVQQVAKKAVGKKMMLDDDDFDFS
jgi:DNA topoisomerase-2